MNKKLIFLDLDGTLLDKEGKLSLFTIETIKSIAKRGHIFVIASGRPWRGIKGFYEKLELDTAVVGYNGAHIFHPLDKSFKEIRHTFPLESCKEIIRQIDFPVLNISFDDEHKFYLKKPDALVLSYFPNSEDRMVDGNPLDNLTEDVYSLIFETEDEENDKKIKDLIEKYPPMKCRHWAWSKHSEAYYSFADKGTAAEYVASYYGISREDVIAFGDSPNDYTMMKYAGEAYTAKLCDSKLLLESFPILEKSNSEDAVAYKLLELFA